MKKRQADVTIVENADARKIVHNNHLTLPPAGQMMSYIEIEQDILKIVDILLFKKLQPEMLLLPTAVW